MIESWMISSIIAIIGFISTFAVMRSKVISLEARLKKLDDTVEELKKFMNSYKPVIDHLSKEEDAITKTCEEHSSDIQKLKYQAEKTITMEQVRPEFVTKEMFKQVEKHFDSKFHSMEKKFENGMDKLLNAIKTAR